MNTQTENQPTLRDLVYILFKHKVIIAVCLFSIVTSVILITSTKVKTYKATTTLLLKFGRENAYRHSTPEGTSTVWDNNKKERVNSEIAILSGRDLAEATLLDIGLENIYPWAVPGAATDNTTTDITTTDITTTDNTTTDNPFSLSNILLAKAIKVFLGSLIIEPIEKSDILGVSFFHPDPSVAASSLNKFIDNYLIHHLKIYQEPEQFIFFTTQVAKYKEILNKSESELYNYKKKHSILAIQQQQYELLKQISKFKAQIADNIIERSEILDRIKRLKEQELSGETSQINIDAITNIRGKVTNLKLDEKELLTKYTPDNILIINIQEQIKAAENLIREEELTFFKKEKLSLLESLDSLNAQINAQNDYMNIHSHDLEILNSAEIKLKDLDRKAELDAANYQLYVSRMEEARISKEMDDQKLANVRIVDRATPPVRAQSTKRKISAIIGAIVGLFLGIIIAIIVEFYSHVFNNADDVGKKLRIKVLASIPELK